MSLLELQNIGKIYVSENSTAIGIRGINLSFDIGEFVAVTGKSGSGKTTLLNVLSGIDTYEEGELLVNGEQTSHYRQEDWELFRKEFISFIFQDYNVIDSFTVLQNVELSLTDIKDKHARRKRALELIDRVGMTHLIHKKAAKLSGGQKQRTVIARALAKDSPIILADEPTGNLDAKTGEEIIKLLHDVSKSKLVIVVTHSFSQLEEYATREIRIFDGSVEHDKEIKQVVKEKYERNKEVKVTRRASRGFELGVTRFLSKPRLSIFICLLMILGAVGVFFSTALFIGNIFTTPTEEAMFTHIDGRVVLTRQDKNPLTDAELEELSALLGAKGYIHYDSILDDSISYHAVADNGVYYHTMLGITTTFDGTADFGRTPENDREVMLILPISFKTLFGDGRDKSIEIYNGAFKFDVVGIKYYYDNTKSVAKIVITDSSLEKLKLIEHFHNGNLPKKNSIDFKVSENGNLIMSTDISNVCIDSDLRGGEFYLSYGLSYGYSEVEIDYGEDTEISMVCNTYQLSDRIASYPLSDMIYISDKCNTDEDGTTKLFISEEMARAIFENTVAKVYTQASLFFENDSIAKKSLDTLYSMGYIATTSDATAKVNGLDLMLSFVLSVIFLVLWVIFVVFIAFFVYLCSVRGLMSMQSDIAIMRSMGIEKVTIKISNYFYILINLIPATVVTAITAFLIYTTPATNEMFTYQHAPEYILMFLGLLMLCIYVSNKFNKKAFDESVKKTLIGGGVK